MSQPSDENKNSERIEHLLEMFFTSTKPSSSFEAKLRNRLAQHAKSQFIVGMSLSQDKRIQFWLNTSRLGRQLTYGIGLLIILFLLFTFKPVRAAMERLVGYGYIPEVGFIDLNETQVLAHVITELNSDQRLSVTQAMTSPTQTRIWLRLTGIKDNFLGLEQNPDLWLETGDGQKLYPLSISWTSGDSQNTEVQLQFAAISASEKNIVLRTKSGWAIPLRFIPAMEADVPSSMNEYTNSCNDYQAIKLCILAVITDKRGTYILISEESIDSQMRVSSAVTSNPLSRERYVILQDDQGHTLAPVATGNMSMPIEVPPGGEQQVTETFQFEPISPYTESATLQIPAVEAWIPVEAEFSLDLSQAPQLGSSFDPDIAIDVNGQIIQFNQGEIVRDNYGTRVVLTSSPMNPQSGRLVIGLDAMITPTISDNHSFIGTGFENTPNGLVLKLWWLLGRDEDFARDRLQHIKIESARLALIGPFEITFYMP